MSANPGTPANSPSSSSSAACFGGQAWHISASSQRRPGSWLDVLLVDLRVARICGMSFEAKTSCTQSWPAPACSPSISQTTGSYPPQKDKSGGSSSFQLPFQPRDTEQQTHRAESVVSFGTPGLGGDGLLQDGAWGNGCHLGEASPFHRKQRETCEPDIS